MRKSFEHIMREYLRNRLRNQFLDYSEVFFFNNNNKFRLNVEKLK